MQTISDEDQIRVKQAADLLIEHFDSVRIFVTKHGSDDSTSCFEIGRGNFYAQFGQVTEWLSIQDQYQRNEPIRRDNENR